jgi:hypothetical protein
VPREVAHRRPGQDAVAADEGAGGASAVAAAGVGDYPVAPLPAKWASPKAKTPPSAAVIQ